MREFGIVAVVLSLLSLLGSSDLIAEKLEMGRGEACPKLVEWTK